ncbi:MAG TPA: hypothetical protein VI864_07755 [Candidatus Bathyarchaeia archaeon]|nr:hypothetical protein [Candidatus Bathyarchaeia archaeon]
MVGAKELNGLLNRIGNFDSVQFTNDFDKRLILQKTVYLLQAFGLNIGYRYSWYLRGPYSPELAHTAYSVAENFDSQLVVQFTESKSERRFEEFLSFIKNKKDDQYCLEAIASIHFLAKLYGEKNEQLIYDEVKQKVGQMLKEEFICLWNELWQNGLLDKKI